MTASPPYTPPAAQPAGAYRSPAPGPTAPPVAGGRDLVREDRLRELVRYQRTASPQELEADLATMRGLRAVSDTFGKVLIAAAVITFFMFAGLGLAAAVASPNQPAPAIAVWALGIVLVVLIVMQVKRFAMTNAFKGPFASSLLRRLDVAPGTEVALVADLNANKGRVVTDEVVARSFWAGTSSRVESWQDDWLDLQAKLANGVSMRVQRTSLVFTLTHTQSGGNRTVTRWRTEHAFRDRVEVEYDPALNPGLATATPDQIGARIRPPQGGKINEIQARPGALAVTVSTGARADGTNLIGELADTVAQLVHFVTPQRATVMVDREASPPNDAVERAIIAAGVVPQLKYVARTLPHPATAGGIALLLLAALGVFGTYGNVMKLVDQVDENDRYAGYIKKENQQLASLKGYERDQALERIARYKSTLKFNEERWGDRIVSIVGSAAVLVFSLAGGIVLVRMGRKRAKAAAAKDAAERAASARPA